MKCLSAILVFCGVILCTNADGSARQVAQKINDFSLAFLKKIYNEEQNLVFSPLSISMAFGMLMVGAQGKTTEEIKRVFHLESLSDQQIQDTFYQIILANSASRPNLILDYGNLALISKEISHYPGYGQLLRRRYKAHFEAVGFTEERESLMKRVNQFVSTKTRGLIKKILDEPLPDETKLLLINTIYFHGVWDVPFEKNKTEKSIFHNLNGKDVKVDMMFSDADYNIYGDKMNNFTLLELPYQSNVSMYVLMPWERHGLKRLIQDISEKAIDVAIRNAELDSVPLLFPKFKFDHKPDLKNTLRQLGASRIFDGRADFSGITRSHQLYVSDVFHKAAIEVDETSTKAAAATGIALVNRMGPGELKVDRPFLFFIRDKVYNSNIFAGIVQNF